MKLRIQVSDLREMTSYGTNISEATPSFSPVNTVKALLNPWAAYLILDTPEGRLIRVGGLFKKLDEDARYNSFISLFNSYFADSRCNFTSQIHKFDRFLSRTMSKLTCKGF